jgi:hypothetical protein
MKRIITLLVVAVVLAVIVPAGLGCSATPSEFEVSGNWQAVPGAEEVTWEDPPGPPEIFFMDPEIGPWICNCTDTTTYDGTFEGTSVVEYSLVMQEDLSNTGEGEETFTGKVNGKEGTLFLNYTFDGGMSSAGYQFFTATYTIISGTGELAKLRGTLEIEAIQKMNLWRGTYSGTCWFEK